MWWRDRMHRCAAAGLRGSPSCSPRRVLSPAVSSRSTAIAPTAGGDSVHEKLAAVEIPPIPARARHAGARHRGRHAQRAAIRPQRRRRRERADPSLIGHGRGIADHGDHRHTSGRPTRADRSRQRQLPAHRNRDRQNRAERQRNAHVDYDIPGRSSASPSSARQRDARTARSRWSPRQSATDWHRISSPALEA